MSKHTPGSWRIRSLTRSLASIDAPNESGVASVPLTSVGTCDRSPEHIANARLIAAAPRLLAVLKRIADSSLEIDAYDYTLRGEIDAAIAEAEGTP